MGAVDLDLDLEGGAADGRKFAECSFYSVSPSVKQ